MQWTCRFHLAAPSLLLPLLLLLLLGLNSNTVPAHPTRRSNRNNWLPNPLNLGPDATSALTWLDQSANQLSNTVIHGLNSALPDSDSDSDSAPAPAPNPPPSPQSPSPASSSSTPPDKNYGIAYSPYTAEGTCKPAAQITHDLTQLAGYAFVRIYGTDCDQTRLVLAAARGLGLRVFAGLADLTHFADDLALIIAAAADDWRTIHTVAIGNELLNSGRNTASEIVGAVQAARATLRGAGYAGPVVAVDTVAALLANPGLCAVSDYCAANCHAFFDDAVTAEGAGAFVREQVGLLRGMLEDEDGDDADADDGGGGGEGDTGETGDDAEGRRSKGNRNKKVVITESGWPHAGQPNGKAVPSLENQRAAVRSLREAFAGDSPGASSGSTPGSDGDGDADADADADASPNPGQGNAGQDEVELVLFSSFDDLWKVDNGYTFGAEKFWGILGH